MGSAFEPKLWVLRVVFLALVAAVLIVALLPLSVAAPRIPGPDVVLCVILAWVLRRPDVLPVTLIVVVVLVEDFLFQRPPGLWTLLVLVGSEVMRRQAYREGETPIAVEFGLVAATLTAMTVAERVLLAIALVPQPAFSAQMLHLLSTLAIYPVVVLASVYLCGVRPRPTDGPRILGMRV
ncbi:rod shape-determining protein MreD [Dinoroseobacter sp. PD6]|uniref:rod shape-determining protein MreD n=1 Tax=Dinoroseobacter sp. PD6 TaxID=3028384 RepID=UPI00237AC7C6|nr:rod shape-determining protein MreD [Dinoroseobacter sp. PD6]MDD9717546.1 rod shape-determining protein MreD [Dinoroseobacter sp. PD6]